MAASSTWCVFVLLLIQSAELLPTTKSYDDHPAGEVNVRSLYTFYFVNFLILERFFRPRKKDKMKLRIDVILI